MGPGAQRQATRLATKADVIAALYGSVPVALPTRQVRRRQTWVADKAAAARTRLAEVKARRQKLKAAT